MDLWIRHWKGDEYCDEHWEDTLESAQEILTRWVDDGLVDRVEVRDNDQELIFHCPRTLDA